MQMHPLTHNNRSFCKRSHLLIRLWKFLWQDVIFLSNFVEWTLKIYGKMWTLTKFLEIVINPQTSLTKALLVRHSKPCYLVSKKLWILWTRLRAFNGHLISFKDVFNGTLLLLTWFDTEYTVPCKMLKFHLWIQNFKSWYNIMGHQKLTFGEKPTKV